MTVDGNAQGAPCVFPFKYNGIKVYECLSDNTLVENKYIENTEVNEFLLNYQFSKQTNWHFDMKGVYRRFCATTPDFDKDKLWGYCQGRFSY